MEAKLSTKIPYIQSSSQNISCDWKSAINFNIKEQEFTAWMRAGGSHARLKDYDGECVRAEKVLPRRLRGVCQTDVFTVRKLIVFSI